MTTDPHSRTLRSLAALLVILLAATLLLSACGGSGGGGDGDAAAPAAEEQESSSRRAAPTAPVARFAAPTAVLDLTKVAEAAEAPAGSEPDLELGAGAYARLCAECHGDDGEGVADKGEAIAGMELDGAAFEDLLRTGGGYGNEHNFGPTKISDNGIADLFAFVQTLGNE